jgi:hypothetical protein
LAEQHPNDVMAYVEAKTPFISELEARTLESFEQAER